MAEEIHFQVRIRASEEGASRNLTMAEFGVLLTGINRAINKAASAESMSLYSPRSQEPVGVRSEITRIENGSILITVVSAVTDFMQQNVLQATFLVSILGNAAWDFTKVLSVEIRRALGRIGSEVNQEMVKIEPYIELYRTMDEIENENKALLSQKKISSQNANIAETSLPHKKTLYTFSFEQKGTSKIVMSFSATNRV